MEREIHEEEPKVVQTSNQLCVPQSIYKFASAIDVSSSYVDVSFSIPEEEGVIPQILACTSTAVFHLACGTVLGYSAILIPQLEAPDSEIKVTKSAISWIASIMPLVFPVGGLISGYLVDKIGRINTIVVGSVPFVIGWACIALAQNFSFLMLGRFLTGLSTALAMTPALVYITEIARPDLRGALTCVAPSLTSLGMVAVYAKGAFLNWRTVAWVSIAYYLAAIPFLILWSPESPVWLVSRGRTQDALKSLTYLSRRDKKEGVADKQLEELVKEHNTNQGQVGQEDSSFTKLLRGLGKPTGLKPFLILTALFAFQQFSGIYITIFYAVSFFNSVGTGINPYTCSVGIGIVRFVFGFITVFMMRSFGRRFLLMLSSSGMAIFMFISGYITKEVAAGNMDTGISMVICILLYMSLGVIGLLSIPWTMSAELFPLEIRGMAQGLLVSLAHILMFGALKMYPFLADVLGGDYLVQWLFSWVSLSAVVFVFIFLPETHKKKLTEIQEYFNKHTIYILSKEKTTSDRVTEDIRDEKEPKHSEEEIIRLKNAV